VYFSFIEDSKILEEYWKALDEMPTIKLLVLWEKVPEKYLNHATVKVINIWDLLELGADCQAKVEQRSANVRPATISSIL